MLKLICTIIFTLVIASCGSNNVIVTSSGPIFIEEKLQPFYNRFIDYANSLGIKVDCANLNMYSTDEVLNNTTLGLAKVYSNRAKEIIIYNWFFDDASDISREVVIFHEISHACMNQKHRDNSIMRANLLSEGFYLYYYDYLIKELFGAENFSGTFSYTDY